VTTERLTGGAPPSRGGMRPSAVAPQIVHHALRSDGQTLDAPTRGWFEGQLGVELTDVRVHTGEFAAASAQAIGARAFTAGRDVVLGAQPSRRDAFDVLAHELAHVGRRSDDAVVHRYESGEHAQAGDPKHKTTINGVTMDEGDLAAMGDLYATPDDMYKAPAAELQNLVNLIERDKKFYSGGGGTPVSNAEWAAATSGRPKDKQYLELAKKNDPHFAPPSTGSPGPKGDNKSEWRKYHQQAIFLTIASTAAGKTGVPEEAVVQNGFAAHFLTDAFSAGHLVNKDDAMATAQTAWATQKTSGTFFKETAFTKDVAHRVLSDSKVAALMAGKQLKEVQWGDVTEQRFSEFIWQMASSKPELFFNSFARLVHDQLNQSINDPAKALEVTNVRGDPPWSLSGDETLSKSPQTLKMMQAAVAQSYANLEAAAKLTATPSDLEPFFKAVWDYTPVPTKSGKSTLNTVVSTFTDPKDPKTVAAFAQLVIDQIDTLVVELTSQGYMRDRPKP
jgi:hypothetical protein